jgi:hypothetical protein
MSITGPAYSFRQYGSAIYAGALSNVFKTTDDGMTWSTLTTGLPSYIAVTAVWKDAVSLLAGGSAGFKRSTDDGATWTATVSGLPGFGAYHAFTEIDTMIFVAHDAGVYLSTDHGATWSATQAFPLGTAPIALHVHGTNLYAGTSKGVYWSANNGTTWTAINDGLPTAIFVNALGSDGLYLYAGMNSHSVWRRPLSEVTDVRALPTGVPDRFELAQNYPNPFNPSTTIRYDLPDARHVTVTVHDLLGRQVAVLVDRDQEAGAYELRWDASARPSGVYYYRVVAGSSSAVKKMLFAK